MHAVTQLPDNLHESLKLVYVEHCIASVPYDDFRFTAQMKDTHGPIDIAHNCGKTSVATASLSTLKPIASCTDRVAICTRNSC